MLESLAIDLLRKTVAPRAREAFGWYLVEYGRTFRGFAIGAWGVAAAMAALAQHAPEVEALVAAAAAGGFMLLALLLHLEFFHTSIQYNVSGIQVHSPWRGQRLFLWRELASVRYARMSQKYVVTLRDGQHFSFNHFMCGYQSLLEEVEARLATRATP